MKTLFILRHAKSSWDDATLSDFERPLNERGKQAAAFMGRFGRENRLEPSVILSSPAERAKRTAILFKDAAGFSCELLFDDSIYEASPHTLAQVVSGIDDAHASAMLVGHNPGMEGFIRFLTGDLEPMPTAALAVIDLIIDKWTEIGDGCGELQNIYRPKELTP
jgi:phosphohistidine phosphatase